MLAFSVNKYACVDIPDMFRAVLEKNRCNTSDISPDVCQELGDLYLRVAGSHKKRVTEDVNPYAYISKAQQNNDIREVHRTVPIISDSEQEDESNGVQGISEAVLGQVDTALEDVEERAEFFYALSELLSMVEVIELEDDINLLIAMRRALTGDQRAIAHIKYVKDNYTGMDKILYTVMSGHWTKYIGVA